MTQESVFIEIGLVNYPHSLLSALYGLTDLFRIANLAASKQEGFNRPLIRVSHWQSTEDDPDAVTCVYDTHPDAPNDPLYVILPPSMVEPTPEQATKSISIWLAQKHDAGATLCSVCAGSLVLAEAGLLEGRNATTHWMFDDVMRKRYPGVKVDTDKMVIDDGDIITAGGIMAWTDLGLRLVQRIMGPTLMLETARILIIDTAGREQKYYSNFTPDLHHGDESILKVQHWLQKTGAKDVSMKVMASYAGLEERTFLRRFQKATNMKPTEYCQHIRIQKAREMLEFTHQSVDQISYAVGYEDASAFRKVFHKLMGLTPGDYRGRFSAAA